MLIDSGADLLIFGMGEKQVVNVANKLNEGIDIKDITQVAWNLLCSRGHRKYR